MAYQIQRENPTNGRAQFYKYTNEKKPIFAGKSSAAQFDEKTAEVVCRHLAQLYPNEKIKVVGE